MGPFVLYLMAHMCVSFTTMVGFICNRCILYKFIINMCCFSKQGFRSEKKSQMPSFMGTKRKLSNNNAMGNDHHPDPRWERDSQE
jgi:hypothetical protein